MEIKAKIIKRKSAKRLGEDKTAKRSPWVVRIEYFDPVQRRDRTIERGFTSKSDAIDERNRQITNLKESHGQIQTGERMTFLDLVRVGRERFYKPAVIENGLKVEGVRSYASVETSLTHLSEFFRKRKIIDITTSDLFAYRNWRRKVGSRRSSARELNEFVPVKVATINRELAILRRLMRFAYAQGWVTKDVFFNAEVIDISAEQERTRILTDSEELALLEACSGEREIEYKRTRRGRTETIKATLNVDNPHLRAIILLALDAGMRRGEILKLKWSDIDFEMGVIHILGTHTKTQKPRLVPLTERAKLELKIILEFTEGDRPFPITDFKHAWSTAKRIAGIDDLHFHDLRTTCITRWVADGQSIALAGKVAGHANPKTTMKYYVATDVAIVQGFADVMNAKHASRAAEVVGSQFVN